VCSGNLTQRSDGRLTAAGNPIFWQYTYDTRNRLLTERDPLGNLVTNTYDPVGNRLTEARPHPGGPGVTSWQYDVMNRRTRETNANGELTRYEYDGLDRVKKLIDARTHEYTFDYDLAGRKTRMNYPDTSTEQGQEIGVSRIMLQDSRTRMGSVLNGAKIRSIWDAFPE